MSKVRVFPLHSTARRIHNAIERFACPIRTLNLLSKFTPLIYCLKLKSSVLVSPAPTVIFWLWAPNFSCHAVIV